MNLVQFMHQCSVQYYEFSNKPGLSDRPEEWGLDLEALNCDTDEADYTFEIRDRSRQNSYFVAIQVGPDGVIYYGTFLGIIKV